MNLKSIKSRVTNAFSLIELMVVIAIVALLTAIAVPSYQGYLQQSKVTEVFSLASDLMNQWAAKYNLGTSFSVTSGTDLGTYVDATYMATNGAAAPSNPSITGCTSAGLGGGTGTNTPLGAVCILLKSTTPPLIDSSLNGKVIVFTPRQAGSTTGDTSNVNIKWSCHYYGTLDAAAANLLSPGNCTNATS